MRFRHSVFLLLLGVVTSASAQSGPAQWKTTLGSLHGVPYRMDVPGQGVHGLVVYYHGYSETPVTYKEGPINPALLPILERGYAVVESGYSQTGWALEDAVPETEGLRQLFVRMYGPPKESYVMGHSMGGTLTTMTIELLPNHYDGALALCGLIAPTDEWKTRNFSMLAAFNYYFPGLLPPLDPVPASYREDDALRRSVLSAMDAGPTRAANMRALTGLRSNQDVSNMMVYWLYMTMDFQKKAGGNPFDTRNYIYTGSNDDNALNNGVLRYKGGPAAEQYLAHYYTPTGVLVRPLLDVRTTYDPLVPPGSSFSYSALTQRTGHGKLFVEQYVTRSGHCNITPQETGAAFDELLAWVHAKQRPKPGLLPLHAPAK